jgi:glycosyltransferase involved in cell wall biosynthesis
VTPLRILHCHSTFAAGGKELRAVRLMNAFGDRATHTILSGVPDALGARDAIDAGIAVSFPGNDAPPLAGPWSLRRYRRMARYMRGFDLVLTYNWGAMDAVAARRHYFQGCPPLIHHEDGFNADEAEKLNWKRNLFRRLMLPAARALVVPSARLEGIARTVWKQPADRLHRIPNGIDVARHAAAPEPGAIPGFVRRPDEVVIGTIAGLRPVKNLPFLVRAFAMLPANARLIIVGEGPERAAIEAEAARCGVAGRVHLPGFLAAPHRYAGHFDIFALTSESEQFPIALVEAMAAGLPAVATDVGDVALMVSAANRGLVLENPDETVFAAALAALVADADRRKTIGAANAARARAEYEENAMIARYANLYGIALG